MDKGKKPARLVGKLHLTDLPVETQKHIIGHVNRKDLLNIQCVNSHLLALANAVIYRRLDLTLTNSGDEESGLPNSHAADALQTILASEYDYGKHIKTFRIGVAEEILDQGPGLSSPLRQDPLLMTRLLWDSKSDSSKFLNTALLLVARKASVLETFQWDAPIELSGAVYQALHKITSLRHLRVRLDVTPSPKMVIRHGATPGSHPPPPPTGLPPPSFVQPPAGIPPAGVPPAGVPPAGVPPAGLLGGPSSSYPSHTATKISNMKRKKAGGSGGGNYWANGRAFSGFKTLSSLALMGMSNLECLPEVAECIKASSATLKCLTLSLSSDLARKARKTVAVNPETDDLSESELEEDDLLNDPVPPPTATTQQQPVTNEADIRKEKLAQESILAKIFELQGVAAEGKKIEKFLTLPVKQSIKEESQAIVKKASEMRQTLLDNQFASDAEASVNATRLENLKMIREIADLYITQHAVQEQPKDQLKASWSSAKSTGSSSKPLNPMASGFKPVGTSSGSGSNLIDWNAPNIPSPTSPFIHPDFLAKDFVSSGNPLSLSGSSKPKSTISDAQLAQFKQANQLAQQQAQLAHLQSKQQAQTQAYSSPYNPLSISLAANGLHQYPYDHSQHSSPGVYPDPADFMNSYPQGTGGSGGAQYPYGATHSNGDATIINGHKKGPSSNAKKLKQSQLPNMLKNPINLDTVDGLPTAVDVSAGVIIPSPSSSPQPFFAADLASGPVEESMDVDMDHPDEAATDLGEDQEFVAVSDDSEVPTPRKRAKFASQETLVTQNAGSNGSSSSVPAEPPSEQKVITPDELMQSWIRATHGLQLEELSLEWVPLKGSIIARALDLRVLKRVTFLEVGPQDAFWALLLRLQANSWDISFKNIHTDNVSQPFVKFLASFEGLEELFIHERSSKQEPDPADTTPVTIRDIRKSALRTHITTLKRLMIKNDKNEKWDLDHKTVDFLAKEGKDLTELAFSLNMKTYHRLMQKFAGFTNLFALHLIILRSTGRNPALQQESLSFAVDSLTLIDSLTNHQDMKIKYIAMENSVIALEEKPDQFSKHLRMVIERRKDKKGKGKAPAYIFNSLLNEDDDSGSDVNEVMADVMAGERRLRFPTSFSAVDDVKIFSKEIRSGKL